MTLEYPEHQETNGKKDVTWRTLRTIPQSIMVHARVLEADIHFTLMYTTYHIFLVLPIKDQINKDGEPTPPFKHGTGTKPSVSNLRVLFFPYVERKATEHVYKKALNTHHQAQKGFQGIFFGIPQYQKGYLVYVPSTRKIISSYDIVIDEKKSSALEYMSRPFVDVMAMRPAVSYTPYATSLWKQTGDIIMFAQFEEGDLLSHTHDNAESGDKSYEDSTMPPLIGK